jgi:hypothetical protein
MKTYLSFLLLIALLFFGFTSHSQQSNASEHFPTSRVDQRVNENTKENAPKQLNIRYIYKKNPGDIMLYGNPCALQITRDMGFEYAREHRPDDRFSATWRRFKNNLGTKSKLFFTKGPWWKATVNKRIKRCAQYSGDRRG